MDFQLIFVKDVTCLDFFVGGECPIRPEAFVEETTLSIELPLRLFQDELTIFVGHLFLSSPLCPRSIHVSNSVYSAPTSGGRSILLRHQREE